MISGQDTEVGPTLAPMSSRTVAVAVREQRALTHDDAEERRGRAAVTAAISQSPNTMTPPRHVIRSAPPSGNGADGASPDALRLTPLRCTSAPSFALTHPYLELVYGPILGPTAVLVARNLGRRLAATSGPITVSVVAIAVELGLRASHDEPLGKQSPVRHAIDRLEHTHLVQ